LSFSSGAGNSRRGASHEAASATKGIVARFLAATVPTGHKVEVDGEAAWLDLAALSAAR
jgi:hypothetical protein